MSLSHAIPLLFVAFLRFAFAIRCFAPPSNSIAIHVVALLFLCLLLNFLPLKPSFSAVAPLTKTTAAAEVEPFADGSHQVAFF